MYRFVMKINTIFAKLLKKQSLIGLHEFGLCLTAYQSSTIKFVLKANEIFPLTLYYKRVLNILLSDYQNYCV